MLLIHFLITISYAILEYMDLYNFLFVILSLFLVFEINYTIFSVTDEELIINTIKEMIENKEIYADYFSSTKVVAFNQQAIIKDIDSLMKTYEQWEGGKKRQD